MFYRINGFAMHKVHSARPDDDVHYRSGQIFFMDDDAALEYRKGFSGVDADLTEKISVALTACNPLMQQFSLMRDKLAEEEAQAEVDGRVLKSLSLTMVRPSDKEMRTNAGRTHALPPPTGDGVSYPSDFSCYAPDRTLPSFRFLLSMRETSHFHTRLSKCTSRTAPQEHYLY
jgi:hypothetical protein